MRRKSERIVIQEPPFEELKKKKSCLKRTCLTGCGCIMLFVIASIFLLDVLHGPKQKELKDIPYELTDYIPIYDADSITQITVTKAKDRNTIVQTLAFLPKVVLGPIVVSNQKTEKNESWWRRFTTFVREPIGDPRDIIFIEWRDISAQPEFITRHYETELKKSGFILQHNNVSSSTIAELTFEHELKRITCILTVMDESDSYGTTLVSLKIFSPVYVNQNP